MRFLPSRVYVPIHYEHHTGKKLSFENPTEFNEKVQWMKIFYRPQILVQLVDKYGVRDYVKNKIGSEYLNEMYGVYDKAEDIPFDDLPNKFVVKATHASSYNLIVSDKAKIDISNSIKQLNKWLSINQYYRMGQEWAYKDVPPKLIVEKFLEEDGHDSLIDYKFYCFSGKAKLLEVHLDRAQKHKRGFYDLEFNKLPYRYVSLEKSISTEVAKPSNFTKMIELSEILADKFPFVRVDFYSIKGKIIFGEMTFYPSDGRKDLYPEEYNEILGNYINLPKLDTKQTVFTTIS